MYFIEDGYYSIGTPIHDEIEEYNYEPFVTGETITYKVDEEPTIETINLYEEDDPIEQVNLYENDDIIENLNNNDNDKKISKKNLIDKIYK